MGYTEMGGLLPQVMFGLVPRIRATLFRDGATCGQQGCDTSQLIRWHLEPARETGSNAGKCALRPNSALSDREARHVRRSVALPVHVEDFDACRP